MTPCPYTCYKCVGTLMTRHWHLMSISYEHDSDQCLCYPQTYLDSSLFFFSCLKECYTCVKASDYCLVCIDGYKIFGTSCFFFYDSYVLLGQRNEFTSPKARYLRWDNSKTVCIQTCSQYYYQYNY